MSTETARQPAGVPAGGQFATTAHPEADVALLEMTPGQRAVSLAMDGGDLGQEIGAVVTYVSQDGTQKVRFAKRGAWVTVLIAKDAADPRPYDVLFHTEDDRGFPNRRMIALATAGEVLDHVRARLADWS